jgi:hypothetical protein
MGRLAEQIRSPLMVHRLWQREMPLGRNMPLATWRTSERCISHTKLSWQLEVSARLFQFPSGSTINVPTTVEVTRGGIPVGSWPPWYVAMRIGDTKAASIISSSPVVDPSALGGPCILNGKSVLPLRPTGHGMVRNLNQRASVDEVKHAGFLGCACVSLCYSALDWRI